MANQSDWQAPNNEESRWCWRSEDRIFSLVRPRREGKIYDVIHFSFFIWMLAVISLMWWQKKILFVFLLILLFIYLFCSGIKWEDFYKIIMRENVPDSGQTSCLHIALSSCQPVRNLNSDLFPDGTVNCHKIVWLAQIKTFQSFCTFNRLKIFLSLLQLLFHPTISRHFSCQATQYQTYCFCLTYITM